MRKMQKKQIKDLLRTLEEAHVQIRKAIEKKNIPLASGLLQDCQSSAISIGIFIEQEEGEGVVTIQMLEEYCEFLYQAHEALTQGNPAHAGKICKTLRSLLVKIERSVDDDIKVKLEAVFLPYKASMWDSLESVWKAADAAPDCDAYVIPIPYYDRNPDGSCKEMHYEGNLYPEYVPVTWYGDYDFARRQPDMVFIHNPYDDCNYVTSVAPFFYAKNLKQFTENLIYIPYFVLAEVDSKDKAALENVKHFVTLPGVFYADQVIVQSENMRQVYVNILTKAAGEGTRKAWERKILGLGSPKFDKVAEACASVQDIPEEWFRIIRKPDGSLKKIILYNTSVGALLENGEKMLVKMREVFRIFKENQGEVALLWRPHPLIGATIGSMRPELGMEYGKLVEQYREEGWGIYDDTAELDRAIAISDAYYGDGSSLMQLFKKAGKPVMLQDVSM